MSMWSMKLNLISILWNYDSSNGLVVTCAMQHFLFLFSSLIIFHDTYKKAHKHLHHDDGDGDSIFMFVVNVMSGSHTHRRDKSVRPKRLNKHFDIFIHLLHFSNHRDTWLDLCLTCSVHEIYCLLQIWKLSI